MSDAPLRILDTHKPSVDPGRRFGPVLELTRRESFFFPRQATWPLPLLRGEVDCFEGGIERACRPRLRGDRPGGIRCGPNSRTRRLTCDV